MKYNNWTLIDWKQINQDIWKIQQEIVTAEKNGNRNKVFKLQRNLVTSFAGRALAVRNVVSTTGSKTPGIDNIIWDSPKKCMEGVNLLKEIVSKPNIYKSEPLKRVIIPKGNGEFRPLGIPTIKDRAVQAVYKLAIDPVVECNSDLASFGFRKYRNTHTAIAYLRLILQSVHHPKYILSADIQKCFEKIDHKFLLNNTPICDKNMLKEWLKSGIMIDTVMVDTDEGTPQGGIISPILCNIALNGIEQHIKRSVPSTIILNGKRVSNGVNVIRYADDIIITAKTMELIERIQNNLSVFLEIKGLKLNRTKTRTIHIEQGFDYLGFNIKRYKYNYRLNNYTKEKTVLIIKPSEKSFKSIKEKIRNIIINNKPIEAIIKELNPIIRGWIEHKRISYHSTLIFNKLEQFIYGRMLSWIRQHKGSFNKNLSKFIQSSRNRKWNWGSGKMKKFLINPTEYKAIQVRYSKLHLNPYIKNDRDEILKCQTYVELADFRNKIYKLNKGICFLCKETLYNGERIELHHIIPKEKGGKYNLKNIIPLHERCHKKITHDKDYKFE